MPKAKLNIDGGHFGEVTTTEIALTPKKAAALAQNAEIAQMQKELNDDQCLFILYKREDDFIFDCDVGAVNINEIAIGATYQLLSHDLYEQDMADLVELLAIDVIGRGKINGEGVIAIKGDKIVIVDKVYKGSEAVGVH